MVVEWRLAAILLGAFFSTTNSLHQTENVSLSLSTHDIDIVVNQLQPFLLLQSDSVPLPCTIKFIKADGGDGVANIAQLYPSAVQLQDNATNYVVNILGVTAGHVEFTAQSVPRNNTPLAHVYLRVTVANSKPLVYISAVVGWLYFVAWSVSFYPQIYTNYRRSSVTGLNFDFLALNAVGFALYSAYNLAMFYSENIGDQYLERYPRGLNPVLGNDVVFSVHALFATLLTIGQCGRYERGGQRVSLAVWMFVGAVVLAVAVMAVLAGAVDLLLWLDFLTYCSYIKLLITLIKYVPQAVMNYRRKSTLGWSIGNIFLDFAGGLLSVLQMLMNAYNYNDWYSIFGDPTKFGLGLFSVLFDIFFMVQHYVLYKDASPYEEVAGETEA